MARLFATEASCELLRDADEGFLGFDPIGPLKPHLGPHDENVVEHLQRAVALRYRLLPWKPNEYAAHKHADRLSAASEAVLFPLDERHA
jgi:uncharacterized protein